MAKTTLGSNPVTTSTLGVGVHANLLLQVFNITLAIQIASC